MADQEEPHSLASTFPNPPPFWRDFAPDRIARIDELRKTAGGRGGGGGGAEAAKAGDGAEAAVLRLPDLPEDLVNLQPPAEPADGRWRVFGDHYMLNDKLPTLEEQGITNLPATYPQPQQPPPSSSTTSATAAAAATREAKHYDRALELKRQAKSLLLNFLELSGALSVNPSHAPDKVADLRTILINMHHALNEYRPHQARESAIEMMQAHLDRTRTETVAVRSQVDRARRVLEGLGSLAVPEAAAAAAVVGGAGGMEGALGSGAGAGAGAGSGSQRDKQQQEDEVQRLRIQREADVWAGTDALFA